MSDETALPSPCISICQLDRDSGRCVSAVIEQGAEIAAWRSMSPDAQRDLLDVLRDRARRLPASGVVQRAAAKDRS